MYTSATRARSSASHFSSRSTSSCFLTLPASRSFSRCYNREGLLQDE